MRDFYIEKIIAPLAASDQIDGEHDRVSRALALSFVVAKLSLLVVRLDKIQTKSRSVSCAGVFFDCFNFAYALLYRHHPTNITLPQMLPQREAASQIARGRGAGTT
jgi:hypothetical protein